MNAARIIRAPGRIIIDPTDLTQIDSAPDVDPEASDTPVSEPGDITLIKTGSSYGPATDNYGGTMLGYTRAFVLQPFGVPYRVMSEALGEATDVLEADNRYVATFLIRGWDNSAIEQLLPGGYAVGDTTQHAVWSEPGDRWPGQSGYDRRRKILYVPDDVARVPALLLYAGIADWVEGAEIPFQRTEELVLPIAVECLRDSKDRILSVGMIDDLEI